MMSSHKIAVATHSPVAYSETFIQMQMERLPCVLRVYGGPVASDTMPGGPIAPLKSLRGLVETIYGVGVLKSGWVNPQTKELGRRLKREGVTAVLANFGPTGVRLLPACKALSIPLVVHFHGYDAHRANTVNDYAAGYRELGHSAAAFIAVSNVMKNALIDLGIPKDRITVARCCPDPARFKPMADFQSSSPVFFGVGRFTDKKAPYLTTIAFAKALPRIPSARLVLAGDGDLLDTTVNLSRILGVRDSVDFIGVQEPKDVADWMAKSTAFVQHSITPSFGKSAGDSEGTPVAVMEAMLSGIPVISTRHAGIGEVIEDGRTGLLVEEFDVDSMADAMVAVALDSELRNRLGRAAREEALAHYNADSYIGKLQRVIDTVAV